MDNLAKNIHPDAVFLESGRVVGRVERAFGVLTEGGLRQAGRAVSCLVEPRTGDDVLLSVDADRCHILAVLEREDGAGAETRLLFDGDVTLAAPAGRVTLAARDDLRLTSERLTLQARTAEAGFDRISMMSRVFLARFDRVKAVGRTLDTVFQRLVGRFRTSYRYVEEHDELQAGSMRQIVDGTLNVQTENTIHTAEGHIKLDAEQIHLA
ncbi:MAG: DUF3540 domain-containing protein [Proteobacteria bacterium]|nr:DUF3540 domain-containing protein [Pseudomonadota bacterium]